jgi:hypothetical protein
MSNLMALHGKEKNGFSMTGGSVRVVFKAAEILCDDYLAPHDKIVFCLWKQHCLSSEQA